ncbi:MAG TPA: adenylate kinase [Vicinamibacterales bacterium]|nr:adenylate kinase [Vicinamibacterales bacterium]
MARDSQPVRLVMLGAPGAGKGTQAERFGRTRGVPRISTGDTLREAVSAGTSLGRESKQIMDAGQLVGDDIMIALVKERLSRPDTRPGFVLDGFPRTVAQAVALDAMLDQIGPVLVVSIEVPEEVLVERLTLRRICANCGWNAVPGLTACAQCGGPLVVRRDDGAEIVRERLRVYGRDTQPLVEFYRTRPTFRVVDGDQTPDAVADDIAAAVASAGGAHR